MKKFTKILALIVAVALMAALMAGCGSSSSGSTSSTASSSSSSASDSSASSDAADDTVYKIKFDYPNAESSVGYRTLAAWAEYLYEESDGRLDITVYSGGALGALSDCVTNCESGVTDGFWSGVTIYPGVFPITEVFGLPMIGANDYTVVNDALNAMLEEYPEMSDEWSDLHVVALHSSAGSPILFAKNVSSVEEMAGLNLRISNSYTTQWFQDKGANPVSLGINDGYENISKGVIDGGLFFFDQVESSALYEVIDALYVGQTIYPLNMICLNKDVYESLPADLQQMIDDSAEFYLETSIEGYDQQQADMIAKCEEYGVNIIYETDESIEWLSEDVENAWNKWVDTMDGLGYDGQAILDAALGYIEQYNG